MAVSPECLPKSLSEPLCLHLGEGQDRDIRCLGRWLAQVGSCLQVLFAPTASHLHPPGNSTL